MTFHFNIGNYMTKTSTKNRKLVANVAKTVPLKRKNVTMRAYVSGENVVAHVEVAGKVHTVKSDGWYIAYPANDGPIGYPRVHCLIKKGIPLFATEKNYMRPRMYKPLNEIITDTSLNVFERR